MKKIALNRQLSFVRENTIPTMQKMSGNQAKAKHGRMRGQKRSESVHPMS